MKAHHLLILVVGLVLGAEEKKPELKGDWKKLQGTWKATSAIYNGDELPADGAGKIKLTIKGNTGVLEADKSVRKEYGKLEFKLDETVKPKIIDTTIKAGGQKGITLESIYKLEGDKLTICTKVLGSDRPSKFESPAGESIALIVLERVKE